MPKESLLLVQTSLPDDAAAAKLAAALIEKRLAACAQIAGPVESVYRWQGAVEKQREFLLTVKTCRENCQHVMTFLIKHHPYTTPEVIAIPIGMVNDAYLNWAIGECGSSQ